MKKRPGRAQHQTAGGKGAKMPAISDSLPVMLLRSREAVMRYFRPLLRRQNVTEQQWRVLRALDRGGSVQVTELARISSLPHEQRHRRIISGTACRGAPLGGVFPRDPGLAGTRQSPYGILFGVSPTVSLPYLSFHA